MNLMWRIGRRIYARARGEIGNSPLSNGEYALISRVCRLDRREPLLFLDVGANVGDWSAQVVHALSQEGRKVHVHAFEPCSSTFAALKTRFKDADMVSTHNLALSDFSGPGRLSVSAPMAGTNSLACAGDQSTEAVTVTTVDKMLAEGGGNAPVTMVKSDTEGFDVSVLRGASTAFQARRIQLWQFEYNWRWVNGRSFLRDVFLLAQSWGYQVGKLTPGGWIHVYEDWNPELERFFEANYCLVLPQSPAAQLCTRYRFNRSNVPERSSDTAVSG